MRNDAKVETVRQFLETQSTLVLCTVDSTGIPHTAPLFYVVGEHLELYWVSSNSCVHIRNIETQSQVSASIFRSTFEWREIVGVQMQGSVARSDGEARSLLLPRYRERFNLGPLFSVALAASVLYVFRPIWIRYVDNSRGFRHKFELNLGVTN